MKAHRADADLPAQAELLTVVQSCGGVHHHCASIHFADKPHRRGVVTGDDRGGVARTITGDVLQCLIQILDHFDCERQRQELAAPILVLRLHHRLVSGQGLCAN